MPWYLRIFRILWPLYVGGLAVLGTAQLGYNAVSACAFVGLLLGAGLAVQVREEVDRQAEQRGRELERQLHRPALEDGER